MIIVDFTKEHIPQAVSLILSNYAEELSQMPYLPPVGDLPDLEKFTNNEFGVTAIEGSEILGFLCFYPIRNNAFTTYSKGTFSPLHGHGAVFENRSIIYKRMYQAAAAKLVTAGASSHSISLFANDEQAINAFFTYGFGLRCIDAVRPLTPIDAVCSCGLDMRLVSKEDLSLIRPLRRMLTDHLSQSPCFMYLSDKEFNAWLELAEKRESLIFAAFDSDNAVAFIEISKSGENFLTCAGDMQNICGAFCLPSYRGKRVFQCLLNFVISKLTSEGYKRVGVDFESFNPTAMHFWPKYFTPYTKSVVRRIDEKVFSKV
ncbi:MAG: GNAT family N-acetyltransferase [Clostridiaceae bacterium]|nr:GNAT family N-acetyltransferase [Clostridiaceae bacterium]